MIMKRKIQIISPPNDQLTGVYLPNNLAEQWRSILRLVYPVGISRDFNLVPIPGNPNIDNDTKYDFRKLRERLSPYVMGKKNIHIFHNTKQKDFGYPKEEIEREELML